MENRPFFRVSLDSWDNVYLFYKQYHHCYDGSIAEGAADKIELLWSEKWSTTPRMLELVKKDDAFKSFIWARIHEEIFPKDRFDHVSNLAKLHCPNEGEEFCAMFVKQNMSP